MFRRVQTTLPTTTGGGGLLVRLLVGHGLLRGRRLHDDGSLRDDAHGHFDVAREPNLPVVRARQHAPLEVARDSIAAARSTKGQGDAMYDIFAIQFSQHVRDVDDHGLPSEKHRWQDAEHEQSSSDDDQRNGSVTLVVSDRATKRAPPAKTSARCRNRDDDEKRVRDENPSGNPNPANEARLWLHSSNFPRL